jgi:hypothetical protein
LTLTLTRTLTFNNSVLCRLRLFCSINFIHDIVSTVLHLDFQR